MKSVHKMLKLHHYKHTGKIIAHKHTSYRVLFLLMLVPIALIAFIDQVATASDLLVSAKVAAPMPAGAPTIDSPADNVTIDDGSIDLKGTCPVIIPAVLIAAYDGDAFIGSTKCGADGKYSIPVTLNPGPHTLIVKVITITDDVGASSNPVRVTYIKPEPIKDVAKPDEKSVNTSGAVNGISFGLPVEIIAADVFLTIRHDGSALWRGKFVNGTLPYKVQIDWGDGNVDTYGVSDNTDQLYAHDYGDVKSAKIVIKVEDSKGGTAILYSAATSLNLGQDVGFLQSTNTSIPIVTFVQEHLTQIYIFSTSALVFLWYIEHGRHVAAGLKRFAHLRHH